LRLTRLRCCGEGTSAEGRIERQATEMAVDTIGPQFTTTSCEKNWARLKEIRDRSLHGIDETSMTLA
jgi:hypothetical protein